MILINFLLGIYFTHIYTLIIQELEQEERRFSAQSAAMVSMSTVFLIQDFWTETGGAIAVHLSRLGQVSFERDGFMAFINWPIEALDYVRVFLERFMFAIYLGLACFIIGFFAGLYAVIAHCFESAYNFAWPNFSALFRVARIEAMAALEGLLGDFFWHADRHINDFTGPQGIHNPELEQMRLEFIRQLKASQTVPGKYLRYKLETENYDELTPEQIDSEIQDFFSKLTVEVDGLAWAQDKGLLNLTQGVEPYLTQKFLKYDNIDIHEALRLLWVSMHDVPNFKNHAEFSKAASELLYSMGENKRINLCAEGQLERLLDSQARIHKFYPSKEDEDLHPVDKAACGQYFMRNAREYAKAALLDSKTDLAIIKACREDDGDYTVTQELWAVIREKVLQAVTRECAHPKTGVITQEAQTYIHTFTQDFDRNIGVLAIYPGFSLDEKNAILEREYVTNEQDSAALEVWLNDNEEQIVKNPLVPALGLLRQKNNVYGTFNSSSSESSFSSSRPVI